MLTSAMSIYLAKAGGYIDECVVNNDKINALATEVRTRFRSATSFEGAICMLKCVISHP